MRISDWSSDVCSSDLLGEMALARHEIEREGEAGSDEGQGEIKPALARTKPDPHRIGHDPDHEDRPGRQYVDGEKSGGAAAAIGIEKEGRQEQQIAALPHPRDPVKPGRGRRGDRDQDIEQVARSEEHTSELQSLMRISYAVFC